MRTAELPTPENDHFNPRSILCSIVNVTVQSKMIYIKLNTLTQLHLCSGELWGNKGRALKVTVCLLYVIFCEIIGQR